MDANKSSSKNITNPLQARIYSKINSQQKEIRLLIIQAGAQDEPLRGDLKCVHLSQEPLPSYETISYVWGDHNVRGSIYLSGQLLDVAASAENVLRRMRHKHQQRVLWIDAICINQDDLDERGDQVTLMAEIYGKTSRNLIWLGEDILDTNKEVLDGISAILEDMRMETGDFKDLTKMIYTASGGLKYSETKISAEVNWIAILGLFLNPWFTRIWIVQEASLPARSVCYRGLAEIPLEDILRTACWIVHKTQFILIPQHANGIEAAIAIFMYADHKYGRHNLLLKTGASPTISSVLRGISGIFNAHDARDHVYGVLGLYQKYMMWTNRSDIPSQLVPNYRKPLRELFRDVARLMITTERKLGLLYWVRRRPDDASEGIPSWAPRWHQKHDGSMDQGEMHPDDFSADAGETMDISCLDSTGDPNSITVRGILVATVRTTIAVVRETIITGQASAMRALLDTIHEMSGATSSDPSTHARIAHTLTNGCDGNSVRIKETESAVLYAAFRHFVFTKNDFPDFFHGMPPTAPKDSRNASSYFQALANSCFHRRFFVTDQGYIGIGHLLMQPDDVIVILYGSNFPLILRPLAGKNRSYELIGYCCIQGIMDGEAVRAHRATGQADEILDAASDSQSRISKL